MNFFDSSAPWAIQPESLLRLESMATEYARSASDEAIAASSRQSALPSAGQTTVSDGIAVIQLTGPLTKGFSWVTAISGGTPMLMAGAQIEQAAADPKIKGIMLQIDSPGGTVDGTEGLARVIRAAGSTKPVIALASGTMASAAYWAGSAASAIYIDAGTTMVGSIGVVAKHVDISGLESRIGIKTTEVTSGKYKRIASMHEPLSDDGRSTMQAQLDAIYSLFVQAVATNRGASVQTVLDRMADGRVFIGQQAIDAGLVDGFATASEVLSRLRAGQQPQRKTTTTEKKTMTISEAKQAAVAEVGRGGTPAQYQAALDRIMASSRRPEPSGVATGPTDEEKIAKASAYAKQHGVDLVAGLKALGFAK